MTLRRLYVVEIWHDPHIGWEPTCHVDFAASYAKDEARRLHHTGGCPTRVVAYGPAARPLLVLKARKR